VAALGGACNIGLQRHDGSDESARRIAEAQFVCGCFGCSLVDGHARLVEQRPDKVKTNARMLLE
jgi:hypothetical protein